jgi:GNAT superfamily N-acetyltransferase
MAESLELCPVQSASDRRAFLNLPYRLYENCEPWVPRLRQSEAELSGLRKHPFWLDAEGQAFLARRGSRVVGRIVALVNHAHNRRFNERRGFFGFFDADDDPEVAHRLFSEAKQWCRQRGLTAMRGPVFPSLNYECGLLIEGFDLPPTFMMPYNHAYYERLIVAEGGEKCQDVYAFDAHVDMLERLDPKIRFAFTEVKRRFGVETRALDPRHFKRDIELFLDIYNRSLVGTWGFVPLSKAELGFMAKSLQWLLVPKLTSFASIEGKPIGVGWGMPDFNPAIKRARGRLFPFGWWYLLQTKKRCKRIRLLSTNVLPEYHGWGLGLATLERILPGALEMGVSEAEFSFVLESNHFSRATLERAGTKRTRSYRLYDFDLSG